MCDTDVDLPPAEHSCEMKTTCHTGGGDLRPPWKTPAAPAQPACSPSMGTHWLFCLENNAAKITSVFFLQFKNGYVRKDQKDPFGSAFALVPSLAVLCYVLLERGLPATVQKRKLGGEELKNLFLKKLMATLIWQRSWFQIQCSQFWFSEQTLSRLNFVPPCF